jgi:hypothetical protein
MSKKIKHEWRLHKAHGYMLLGPVYDGTTFSWRTCVTSLCLNTRETEDDEQAWAAHKLRLRVNGGCGAVSADVINLMDGINPAFKRVASTRVPAWIVNDFTQYLTEESV